MKRECGNCTLCCRLVPVADNLHDLHKGAGERCPHQRHTGCAIYAKRPLACQFWNCKWLTGEAQTKRPDRAHYVIDDSPDYVTQDGRKVPVIQVWCDTRYPFAYRDPDLLAFLESKHRAALVRFNNERGIMLVPPSCSPDGQAYEMESNWVEKEHTAAEIFLALNAQNERPR